MNYTKHIFTALIILAGFADFSTAQEPNDTQLPYLPDVNGMDAGRIPRKLVEEGVAVNGIDGKLQLDQESGKWIFEPYSQIKGRYTSIEKDTQVPVLPSSMLENMTEALGKQKYAEFRVWGRIMRSPRYNTLYPIYAVGLKDVTADPNDDDSQQQPEIPAAYDPNAAVVMPEDVMKSLQPRRVVSNVQLTEALKDDEDAVIVDRSGLLGPAPEDPNTYIFRLDGFGWNFQGLRFELLENEQLRDIVSDVNFDVLSPGRIEVSGVITKYQGKNYLLLQRAVKVYSHGNFDL